MAYSKHVSCINIFIIILTSSGRYLVIKNDDSMNLRHTSCTINISFSDYRIVGMQSFLVIVIF
jgi:hypothetical protein